MKFLSFLIAIFIVGIVIIYPRAIATDMHSVPMLGLVLLLSGMSLCFIYSLGARPKSMILRLLLSPLVAWPMISLAILLISISCSS